MNAFAILFVLLISIVGVLSNTDSETGSEVNSEVSSNALSFSRDVRRLATRIEENLLKIKAIECRNKMMIPNRLEPKCDEFLNNFKPNYKNCFCHKKEVSLSDHWTTISNHWLQLTDG